MIAIRKTLRGVMLKIRTALRSDKNTFTVDTALVSELKNDINLRSDTSNYSPSWKAMIEEFKDNIRNQNINNFLRWDIVKLTITSTNSTLVDTEYKALKNSPEFNTLWKPLLAETGLGNPEPYWGNVDYGVNKIHQVYHLMRFNNFAPDLLKNLALVVEFGGGYGNMGQLFHRINANQKYFIFDFPEMLALQKFYLNSLQIKTGFEDPLNNYCTLFSDNKKLASDVKNVSGKKLFIATWSFSESPIALREEFTPMLKDFDYFIIAFQNEFDQVTNIDYFEGWKKNFDNFEWEQNEIPHFRNSYYLIGKRK